jgi:hypothetical protein
LRLEEVDRAIEIGQNIHYLGNLREIKRTKGILVVGVSCQSHTSIEYLDLILIVG